MFVCDGILWESGICGSVNVFVAISVDGTGCSFAGPALASGLLQQRALLSEHRVSLFSSHHHYDYSVSWKQACP